LDEYQVTYQSTVHTLPRYPDPLLYIEAFADELDHVQDFSGWAGGNGKANAQAVEDKLRTLTFETLEECQQKSYWTMFNQLTGSFDRAVRDTNRRWDQSGKHRITP
jgi:hypothetical protein